MAVKLCDRCESQQDVSVPICAQCGSDTFSPIRPVNESSSVGTGLVKCSDCGREWNNQRLQKCPGCSSTSAIGLGANSRTHESLTNSSTAAQLDRILYAIEESNKKVTRLHWAVAAIGIILIVAFYVNGINVIVSNQGY